MNFESGKCLPLYGTRGPSGLSVRVQNRANLGVSFEVYGPLERCIDQEQFREDQLVDLLMGRRKTLESHRLALVVDNLGRLALVVGSLARGFHLSRESLAEAVRRPGVAFGSAEPSRA